MKGDHVSDDLLAKLQAMLGDADLAGQVHGLLGGAGGIDIGGLLAGLQQNPQLMARLQGALGDNPVEKLTGLVGGIDIGSLGGLLGGAGGAAGQGGSLGDLEGALGGLLGGNKNPAG